LIAQIVTRAEKFVWLSFYTGYQPHAATNRNKSKFVTGLNTIHSLLKWSFLGMHFLKSFALTPLSNSLSQ